MEVERGGQSKATAAPSGKNLSDLLRGQAFPALGIDEARDTISSFDEIEDFRLDDTWAVPLLGIQCC